MSTRILVVDDEVRYVRLMEANLASEGYEIYKASNGQEAVDMVNKYHPDLVLLDVMMPGISGFEACQRIREFLLNAVDDSVSIVDSAGVTFCLLPSVAERCLDRRIGAEFRQRDPRRGVGLHLRQSPEHEQRDLQFGQIVDLRNEVGEDQFRQRDGGNAGFREAGEVFDGHVVLRY